MAYLPAGQKVTRPGPNGPVTLTARAWALLADAYKSVGLPEADLVVNQGSWHHGSASGSTHDGGGAFDLRVWNLPPEKVGPLVVALRSRGVCAWKRDQIHGNFQPHIHGIDRNEAGLSDGAQSQVNDYDRGGNGLSGAAHGKDYHPRPKQVAFRYGPPPAPWGGKNIGWLSSQRPQILAAQKTLAVRQTGTYLPLVDRAFRAAIEAYQRSHPDAAKADGTMLEDGTLKKPGVIGPNLYRSLLVHYPAG